jgi:hypothetical protein
LNQIQQLACSASLRFTTPPETATSDTKKQTFFGSSSKNILKKFRKDIDEGSEKSFADSLSPSGKLFEIYFVRLIGTPNQNSKNGSGLGWNRV